MITVSLIRELNFISLNLGKRFSCLLDNNEFLIEIVCENNMVDLYFGVDKIHLWHESIEGQNSFWGIESAERINKCIGLLQFGNMEDAKKLFYFENQLDSKLKV